MTMAHVSSHADRPLGQLVRHWRERRGLTQMRLAHDADVSPRHLSFIETGRSQPSREVVLRLAQELAIPLRQRNTLLLAGGFAPARHRVVPSPSWPEWFVPQQYTVDSGGLVRPHV